MLSAIIQCLTSRQTASEPNLTKVDEKISLDISIEEMVNNFLNVLFAAEKSGRDLEEKLKRTVQDTSWNSYMAEAIIHAFEEALKKGKAMNEVIKDAFDKSYAEAFALFHEAYDFSRDHPLEAIFTTIVVIGILVLLAPWVLEAVGFGTLGPIEGKLQAYTNLQRVLC
jgi:hypothetical protein